VCDVAFIFRIESGSFDGTALDGLNVALAVHAPGPMADGNWSVAAYIDQRANEKQTEALGAIFTGAAGGPMAQLAPLIGKNLGVKKTPITYRIDGKKRSAEIPNILHMAVDPLPTAHPSGEMVAAINLVLVPVTHMVDDHWRRQDAGLHPAIYRPAGNVVAGAEKPHCQLALPRPSFGLTSHCGGTSWLEVSRHEQISGEGREAQNYCLFDLFFCFLRHACFIRRSVPADSPV
jgi:hypothetical protein